jgi:hypothetical protein
MRCRLMPEKITYEQPSKVSADDGAVVVDGPNEVDVQLTPEAAEETADRLTDEAVVARGQRRLRGLPHKPKK